MGDHAVHLSDIAINPQVPSGEPMIALRGADQAFEDRDEREVGIGIAGTPFLIRIRSSISSQVIHSPSSQNALFDSNIDIDPLVSASIREAGRAAAADGGDREPCSATWH